MEEGEGIARTTRLFSMLLTLGLYALTAKKNEDPESFSLPLSIYLKILMQSLPRRIIMRIAEVFLDIIFESFTIKVS